jgi:hypothetical protein
MIVFHQEVNNFLTVVNLVFIGDVLGIGTSTALSFADRSFKALNCYELFFANRMVI